MTAARKFTLDVPKDRIVRLPDDIPEGRVVFVCEPAPAEPDERAAIRQARVALLGSMPELAKLGDALLEPMDEEEQALWEAPIDPREPFSG